MTVTLIARKDRRSLARLGTPKCPQCHSRDRMVAVLRSSRFVHFKCMDCGELRTVPKTTSAFEAPATAASRR